ncbi:MAG: aspartate-semialdehyde dehydrogenase [Gemmatimonadaceae bacterium]
MSAPRAGDRIPVAVLGATGAVGQAFVRLLAAHPWFRLAEVSASERSAGKSYRDAARWLSGALPDDVAAMTVLATDPSAVRSTLVFSALEADAAAIAEPAFARAGRFVLSNASCFRMEQDVPLIIPEVNPEQLGLLVRQRENREWKGAIVTNPNCAAIVIAMALAPLDRAFGLRKLFVSTMQAVSGAGYPGVPSLDILGNVVPFINKEEGKIESETVKLLSRVTAAGRLEMSPATVSAHANRVPVEHGHTAVMSAAFETRPTPDEALAVLESWRGDVSELALPSSPARPLVITREQDRPQPRRDADAGGGMAVTVGRVRADPLFDIRLVAMGHNIIRGAAGASILNAELLVARGILRAM